MLPDDSQWVPRFEVDGNVIHCVVIGQSIGQTEIWPHDDAIGKVEGVIRVTRIHPVGIVNVFTKFRENQ